MKKYQFYRFLDRYVGILVLSLFSLWTQCFTRKKTIKSPKKILIIGVTEAGAMVCCYPMIQYLQSTYPNATIHALTSSLSKTILTRFNIDAHDIRTLSIVDGNIVKLLTESIKTLFFLWRTPFDVVINTEIYVRFPMMLTFLSGATYKVGYHPFNQPGNYTGDVLTHKLIYTPFQHISTSYLNLAKAIQYPPSKEPLLKEIIPNETLPVFEISIDTEKKEILRKTLNISSSEKLIIIHPNYSDKFIFPLRRWTICNYKALINHFLDQTAYTIILTGVKGEEDKLEQLKHDSNNPSRVVNLANKTSFDDLLTLYSTSDLLICSDSGPGHFSSLIDIPTLVLFGPEKEEIFGSMSPKAHFISIPLSCRPCINPYNYKVSSCTDNVCMKKIDPDTVFQKALHILK